MIKVINVLIAIKTIKKNKKIISRRDNATYFEEHLLGAASDFLKQLKNTGEQLLLG